MSNMVGAKNKWNDMVECGGIVSTSEQWLRLVIHEGSTTESQKDIVVVVILSGVTLDEFQPFGLHQEGGWALLLDSQYKEGEWRQDACACCWQNNGNEKITKK